MKILNCERQNDGTWLDLETEEKFSHNQFRSPGNKRASYNDSAESFLDGEYGTSYMQSFIDVLGIPISLKAFVCPQGIVASPSKIKNFDEKTKLLIVAGGPSTKAAVWDENNFDHLWSCNKFYLDERLRNIHFNFVALATDVKLSENSSLEKYLAKNKNTIIGFEPEDLKFHEWHQLHQFVSKYLKNIFFFQTRYRSTIGLGVRMICLAILMGYKDISFVGIDGLSDSGTHSFEGKKTNPNWYKQYGPRLQVQQFAIFWDYIKAWQEKAKFTIHYMGKNYEGNISSHFTQKYFGDNK